MKRGKFRPRLQQLVASNGEDVVKKCSRKAFSLLPDVQAAIAELSSLKGVGPATASGWLTTSSFVSNYNWSKPAIKKDGNSIIHLFVGFSERTGWLIFNRFIESGSKTEWGVFGAPCSESLVFSSRLQTVWFAADCPFCSSCVGSWSPTSDCVHVWWGCGKRTGAEAHPVHSQTLRFVPEQGGCAVCKTKHR